MRALANDKSIVIKKADKDLCVVVWDRNDYIAEAEKQLKDEDNIMQELEDNKLFKSIKTKGSITEKELKSSLVNLKRPQI